MWETRIVHSFLLALQVKELMKELLYGKRHAENKYETPPFFQPRTILQTAVIGIVVSNYSQYLQQ